MKELKFKFDLDCKFAVYVPSTTDVNNTCDNADMVKYVLSEMGQEAVTLEYNGQVKFV